MWSEIIWTLQFIAGSLFILILLLPVWGLWLPIGIDLMSEKEGR